MKRELVNFVAVIGLVMLGAAVILGLLTGALFLFPNLSIFGARAVKERNTQIVYCDDALRDAFANGKFIIESSGTNIEVKMSSKNYKWENTVVVEESATGIAFNSLNRTLIEWTQTKYNHEVYYCLKVLEPSGMVFSDKPTTVYINLPYGGDVKYDFVLRNKYSPVNFSFVSPEPTTTDALKINNLVVESAASVTIPYNANTSVDNISLNGNNTKFNCEAKVLNHVVVEGNKNNVTIGSTNAGINGDVVVRGNNNHFTGTSAHDVTFNEDNGSLKMTQTIASLSVATVNASVTVHNVTGKVDVKQTQTGSLNADSIGGGLTFNAGILTQPNATADLTVGALAGDTVVENYGVGEINLSNVNGNVDILSKEVNGGAINVAFANGSSGGHTVTILGYDGNINVTGIKGGVVTIGIEGEYHQAGYATVSAQFDYVGIATINTGAYPSGNDGLGDVKLTLSDRCNVKLNVFDARHLGHTARYNAYINDNHAISKDTDVVDNLIHFNPLTPLGTLRVNCQNSVYLY